MGFEGKNEGFYFIKREMWIIVNGLGERGFGERKCLNSSLPVKLEPAGAQGHQLAGLERK